MGTIDSGHYIAYIRGVDGSWFKCNDEWVTSVPVAEVLDSEAYLLFYVIDNV